jgi:hypothetical protein
VNPLDVADAVTHGDRNVAAILPAKLPENLVEGGDAGPGIGLIGGISHQHADTPDTARCSCTRRTGRRNHRPTDQADELAPFHSGIPLAGRRSIGARKQVITGSRG